MFLPVLVYRDEQNPAFELAEIRIRNDAHELVIFFLQSLMISSGTISAVLEYRAFLFRLVLDAETALQLGMEAVPVPFFGIAVREDILRHLDVAGIFNAVHNILTDIFALEDPAAEPVNDLALLVHHVVVIEQILTRIEALRLMRRWAPRMLFETIGCVITSSRRRRRINASSAP